MLWLVLWSWFSSRIDWIQVGPKPKIFRGLLVVQIVLSWLYRNKILYVACFDWPWFSFHNDSVLMGPKLFKGLLFVRNIWGVACGMGIQWSFQGSWLCGFLCWVKVTVPCNLYIWLWFENFCWSCLCKSKVQKKKKEIINK